MKGITSVELLSTLSILVVLIALAMMPFIRFSSTGQGRHSGFVTAVEQEGYFFPNYRVYFKTDNSSSQEDVYCMDRSRTDLADKFKQYNALKQRVTVEFNGVRGFGAGLCHDVEITGVTVDQ